MELTGLQKVHIIPVGFEFGRIIEPLEKIKADKVFLITDINDFGGHAKYFYEKSKKEIERKITKDIERIPCNIWNLTDLLNKLSTLIFHEKSQKNFVFINVSSGNKLFSIAATIAGMMYGANLYYAKAEKQSQYKTRKDKKGNPLPITFGPYIVEKIPQFTINPPKDDLIKSLAIIEKNQGIKQYNFIIELEKIGVLKNIFEDKMVTRQRKPQISKNTYGLFRRNILKPLEEDKFILIEGSGKKMRIHITDEGKNTLKVFETIALKC